MSKAAFFQFPRAFYVINGIELLERGAFYTMNYILATYLLRIVGLPASQVGVLAATLFVLLYVIPLLGAPLAEKYGYKLALVATFILLTGGYASLFLAGSFATTLLAVTLIGLGAGIFKPIAAAVVSQSSSESQRNFAFIIYYGAINLGATVFPLAVAILGLTLNVQQGILALLAFGTAVILSAVNFVLVLTMWRNLREPDRAKSVVQSFAALGEIFRYPKLLTLFVIYTGFWFLYAMSLSFLPAYMVEFGRMPVWFNVLFLGAVNPAVIVLVAPFLGKLTKPFGSLQLMVVGIALYVVGFVTLGFSGTAYLFIGGVVLFSIGEVLTHPSFLAYVTKVAPPDKVSVFLGYGFLPIAVGLFFGAGVGGVLYERFAQQAGQPALFWAIMSGVACVAVAALLIYNRFVTPAPKPVAPGPGEPRRSVGGAMGTFGFAALALLMVPALVVAATYVPSGQPLAATSGEDDLLGAADLATLELPEQTGQAEENADPVELRFTLPATATGVATFTLTWQDEAPSTPVHTNAPDTFKLHIMLPDGTVAESEEESSGTLKLTIDDAGPGEYIVHVELIEAGDSAAASTPLIPIGAQPDTGNDFTLAASHQAQAAPA